MNYKKKIASMATILATTKIKEIKRTERKT